MIVCIDVQCKEYLKICIDGPLDVSVSVIDHANVQCKESLKMCIDGSDAVSVFVIDSLRSFGSSHFGSSHFCPRTSVHSPGFPVRARRDGAAGREQ